LNSIFSQQSSVSSRQSEYSDKPKLPYVFELANSDYRLKQVVQILKQTSIIKLFGLPTANCRLPIEAGNSSTKTNFNYQAVPTAD
jgi:hypothetical protein